MVFLWKDKEQQILSLFHKGKKEAMDKLYMEYADYLTGVCARYISEEDTLKDVLQESFIKVFTQIHQFEYRGKDSLKAWLTRITARNYSWFCRYTTFATLCRDGESSRDDVYVRADFRYRSSSMGTCK